MFKRAAIRLLPAVLVSVVLAAAFILPSRSNLPTHLTTCTSGTFTASPVSPQPPGTTVTETATAACSGAYGGSVATFQFWEFDVAANRWSMVQDYSTTNTHTWNTTGLPCGPHRLEVDIRSQDKTMSYDFVQNMTYTLTCPPPGVPCTGATLTVTGGTDASHGATGGTFVMHGTSASCPNPVYRFWVRDPGRAWSMVQDYSSTTTHTWGPIGTYYLGQYSMEVDVRDASESVAYDVVSNVTFTLIGCTAATVAPTGTGGVHGAAPITFTATATCPGTATYRFWLRDPGRAWSMVQDYSVSNTYAWAAGNQSAGQTMVEVDVRDQGSLETYEFVTSGLSLTLT